MNAARKDLAVRFLLAVAATLLIAPVVGAILPDMRSHRIVTRTFLACFVLALLLCRGPRAFWLEKIHNLGLKGPDRLARTLLGAGLAVAWLAALLLLSWGLGGRESAEPHQLHWMAHALRALLSGLGVAFLEEILFRGHLKNVFGGIVSAMIYAAAHFFTPLHGSPGAGGYDPLLALKRLGDMLEGFTEARNVTFGIFGLFLFGVALNRLRDRTGTLYLGIGLHGGVVFALDFYRRFLEVETAGDPWVFGGSRLFDGMLGVGALALLYASAIRAPLPRLLRPPG